MLGQSLNQGWPLPRQCLEIDTFLGMRSQVRRIQFYRGIKIPLNYSFCSNPAFPATTSSYCQLTHYCKLELIVSVQWENSKTYLKL